MIATIQISVYYGYVLFFSDRAVFDKYLYTHIYIYIAELVPISVTKLILINVFSHFRVKNKCLLKN